MCSHRKIAIDYDSVATKFRFSFAGLGVVPVSVAPAKCLECGADLDAEFVDGTEHGTHMRDEEENTATGLAVAS